MEDALWQWFSGWDMAFFIGGCLVWVDLIGKISSGEWARGHFSLACCGPALGAPSPINHLCLVDLETGIVGGNQARPEAHRAVHIDGHSTSSADEVVVVVSDAVFVEGGGAGGLNTADDPLVGEGSERVVDGLTGDGTDLGADVFGEGVGVGMRVFGEGTKDSESLGSNGEPVLAEGTFWIDHNE
jgi:hypothetical protein